jgi:basic amino acid/polyamine antiporter, APA family
MKTKKLGLFDSILLVSGSMIGSGIFLVTADMTRLLGHVGYVLLAWLLAGIITLLAALHFGELAAMMPTAGGQYNFISRIYGKKMGFIYGWSVFSVIQTGVIAAVAMAFSAHFWLLFDYLFILLKGGKGTYYESLSHPIGQPMLAISSIVLLSWINTKGIQESKWVQRIFTLAKMIALAALIFGGIWIALGGNLNQAQNFWSFNIKQATHIQTFTLSNDDPNSGFSWVKISSVAAMLAFASAMVGSLFSSDAWQGITFMSHEIHKPEKTLPKALFWGTLLVTLIYILANMAYFIVLPWNEIALVENDRVGVAAVGKMLDGVFLPQTLMALLIMVSTFGCNNGLILAGSRLYQAMASEGLFFKKAAQINSKGIPSNALWMQAFWASVLCLSGTYGQLLSYCTFASLLFYIITVAGVLKLRRIDADTHRPYKVWLYPISTWVYLVLAGFVALGILWSQFQIALTGLIIVALAWPIYRFFGR